MNIKRDINTAIKTIINTFTDIKTYRAIAHVLIHGNKK